MSDGVRNNIGHWAYLKLNSANNPEYTLMPEAVHIDGRSAAGTGGDLRAGGVSTREGAHLAT